jgi:hypothetical protein
MSLMCGRTVRAQATENTKNSHPPAPPHLLAPRCSVRRAHVETKQGSRLAFAAI